MIRQLIRVAFGCCLVLAGVPAGAGEVEKKLPFALDKWIDLKVTDGPVTLHRVRVASLGRSPKSMAFRPGNTEYLQDVRIELEYSNESSRDWEARISLVWKDEQGRVIDGYNDSEQLHDEKRYDVATVTLSTLRYGIEKARRLELTIRFYPE